MDAVPLTKLAVVIDDDLSVAETTASAMTLAGVRAIGISDGCQPEHIFIDPPPDACLIDMMLSGSGGRDGVEVARDLRSLGWRCPLIAFSASDQMVDVARTSGLFHSILSKPFDLYQLIETLQKALAES